MKKMILAVAILTIIIVSGILSIRLYNTSSKEISEMIGSVSTLVSTGSWDEAKKKVDDIEKVWDKTEKKWTLLIDHFEIDNIEMSLKKSEKYIETKNTPLSLGELQNLKFMVDHIYEKELFNFENIF